MKAIVFLGIALLTFASSVRADDASVSYQQSDRDRSIRIEQQMVDLEQRVDRLDTSISGQIQTLYIVFFAGIVGLVGFVLWDRRSMIKPVADDHHVLSEREDKFERVLREYAKSEPRLAEILKQYALW